MNKTIFQFLKEQSCAGICCVDETGKPYCFSCFYAFHAESGLLYFKSSKESHHATLLMQHPFVAGTVLPDKLNALVVKGIQFEGVLLDKEHPLAKNALRNYHKSKSNGPGLARRGLDSIRIDSVKMTDSTLGFGKKISWQREQENQAAAFEIINNLNLN
ncbi:MAG: pyridoxamine 5'-phosphate oxidase family protein [Chitinophagaceae bacterium]|nr:pyridoxamine 5'-phosphate oxidase family protein [Chitinophagaceae bacterium]